ncbi:hypothetical protein A3K72_01005 [Candidatus Woesearchaeota archaeon RBG_13_36_6]|nr:MAG: hypothetical protein A3K72_01005 [Candidatus Woesearchaeota archaeon RBG_13_36_6]
MLKKYYGHKFNFWHIQKIIYIGQFFSSFTPGRAGDLVRANYLKDEMGLPIAVSSVISERLFDIFVISLSAIWSFVVFYDELIPLLRNLSTILLVIVFVVIVVSIILFYKLLKKEHIKEALSFIKKIRFESFVVVCFWSFVIWFFTYIQAYLLTRALGFNVSLVSVLSISGAMVIPNLLPITIASIGTTELTAFYLFSLVGVPPGLGVISLWLTNIVLTFMPAFIGYLFYLAYKKSEGRNDG